MLTRKAAFGAAGILFMVTFYIVVLTAIRTTPFGVKMEAIRLTLITVSPFIVGGVLLLLCLALIIDRRRNRKQ